MIELHPGSYRDPSGFIFRRDGRLLRQVNSQYASAFETLIGSGLYGELVGDGLLVRHETVDRALAATPDAYRVIEPERIPFVSQPREWCPSQLRDAALLTLRVLERALAHGMVLKDASAHNVQFIGTRAIFIDSLSFEPYSPGQTWVAYRQFCESFLAPLALARHVDSGLLGLQAQYPDGIPLKLASKTLPKSTFCRPSLLLHLHLHSLSIDRYANAELGSHRWNRAIPKRALEGLNQSLLAAIEKLVWKPRASEWSSYHIKDSYGDMARATKETIVHRMLSAKRPAEVWDFGSNTGHFSRRIAALGAYTVSIDSDLEAVERNYNLARRELNRMVLPLHIDLMSPTPSTGFAHRERSSLGQRGPADMVVALALIHHLCLGRNLPIPMLVEWLSELGGSLLIEFVPKSDPQAQRLLQSRQDIFDGYSESCLETALANAYATVERHIIPESPRVLYLCQSPKVHGPRA